MSRSMPEARRALILSGSGRYDDPWHPFDSTSRYLAAILEDEGWAAIVDGDPESALSHVVDAAALPSLVVADFGLPRDGMPSPASARAADGLRRLVDAMVPVLVTHVSITSLVDLPLWRETVGAHWVRGTSMHPPYGDAHIRVHPHPLTVGMHDFVLQDERYTDLEVDGSVEVLASHDHGGRPHPLMWIRTSPNGQRIAVDALGHDEVSYDSPEHVELLRRMLRWLAPGG